MKFLEVRAGTEVQTNQPVRCLPCATVHCSVLSPPYSTKERIHLEYLGMIGILAIYHVHVSINCFSECVPIYKAASYIGFMRHQECYQLVRLVRCFAIVQWPLQLGSTSHRLAVLTSLHVLAATGRSLYTISPEFTLLSRSL